MTSLLSGEVYTSSTTLPTTGWGYITNTGTSSTFPMLNAGMSEVTVTSATLRDRIAQKHMRNVIDIRESRFASDARDVSITALNLAYFLNNPLIIIDEYEIDNFLKIKEDYNAEYLTLKIEDIETSEELKKNLILGKPIDVILFGKYHEHELNKVNQMTDTISNLFDKENVTFKYWVS